MNSPITVEDIHQAEKAIADRVVRTPSVKSVGLTDYFGSSIALKLETQQIAGCFKPRGIVNKILSLCEQEREKGLITVSGGNHGLALATIASSMNIKATIVMPETAPLSTQQRIQATQAELILTADVSTAFERAESAQYQHLTYLHSYDDPVIMAGHGTVGLELITDIPDLTDVLVSIGGGALISGVATAIKALKPNVRIWGVETEGADAMSQALVADRPVQIQISSISSTLGAPYVTERTLAPVKALVEEVLVVSDAEAVDGVLTLAERAKLWVEPAAGCLIPAVRQVIDRVGSKAVIGLVLCGGNVSFREVAQWVDRFHLHQCST